MVDRQHHIIKPNGFSIPPAAEAIHRISTNRAKAEGKEWSWVASTLLASVKRHSVRMMVAHNIDFDRPIILAELLRAGLPTDLAELPTFCTMKSNVNRTGGRWPTLADLYLDLTGRHLVNAHNALADVEAVFACYQKIEARAHANEASGASESDIMREADELICSILCWAEDKTWFNTDFVEQMQDRLEGGRELTSGQLEALRNIAARFGVQ